MSQPLTPLDHQVRAYIATHGSIAYAELIERALYDPEHGFYAAGGQAGRRGDFITSPEVGPLFGAVIARALDIEWNRLDKPDDFVVTEFGAGPGTLARSILFAEPECLPALRYRTIERSAAQRAAHPGGVEALEAVPNDKVTGVILANELLDNLAFSPVEVIDGSWHEVRVDVGDDRLVEILLPASETIANLCQHLFPGAEVGRFFLQQDAATWVDDAKALLAAGRVIAFDYAREASQDVDVRTYAGHETGGDPLVQLGLSDITIDVDLTQLVTTTGPIDAVTRQAEWLRGHGLDELVQQGREAWDQGAAQGGLAAIRGRSRVLEAEALTDRSSLGNFHVVEWLV